MQGDIKKLILDLVIFMIIINIYAIAGYVLLCSNLFARLKLSTGKKQIDDFIKVPNFYFEKLIDFLYAKLFK